MKIKSVASRETPCLNLYPLLCEGMASCPSATCRLTDLERVSPPEGLPGTQGAMMQKLIITSACQHCWENFDKVKDPVSNSESFLKGEKTTWEENDLASDWLIISTERQLVKLAGRTPSCSGFSYLNERGKKKVIFTESWPCTKAKRFHILSYLILTTAQEVEIIIHFTHSKVNTRSSPLNAPHSWLPFFFF